MKRERLRKARRFLILLFLSLSACAGPQAKRGVATVFDQDDRRRVDLSREPEWRAVGKLVNEKGAYCTATLVSEDYLLTAAHCFFNLETGRSLGESYVFHAGYEDGQSVASAKVVKFWVGTRKEKAGRRGDDWALAKLDQPLGATLGFFPMENAKLFDHMGPGELHQVAYHYDLGDGHAPYRHSGCKFWARTSAREPQQETYFADCDATQGASGSGIFVRDKASGRFKLVGIFVFEFGAKDGKSNIGVPFLINDANEVIQLEAPRMKWEGVRGR